jgi:hypothetical protein
MRRLAEARDKANAASVAAADAFAANVRPIIEHAPCSTGICVPVECGRTSRLMPCVRMRASGGTFGAGPTQGNHGKASSGGKI